MPGKINHFVAGRQTKVGRKTRPLFHRKMPGKINHFVAGRQKMDNRGMLCLPASKTKKTNGTREPYLATWTNIKFLQQRM
jgi:hypothetical protein